MTLMRRTENMFPSFPSFFDKFFEGDLTDWSNLNFSSTNTTLPAINVRENDNEFTIEVAAPGMGKEDFNVGYDNGRLTISSEHKEETREGNGDRYTRREFSYQSFQRSFTVAEDLVDGEKINAKYSDGILHVILPKREAAKPKPARKIKIS